MPQHTRGSHAERRIPWSDTSVPRAENTQRNTALLMKFQVTCSTPSILTRSHLQATMSAISLSDGGVTCFRGAGDRLPGTRLRSHLPAQTPAPGAPGSLTPCNTAPPSMPQACSCALTPWVALFVCLATSCSAFKAQPKCRQSEDPYPRLWTPRRRRQRLSTHPQPLHPSGALTWP